MKPVWLTILAGLLLSACGFKGDLYLPKEDDKSQFGVIQTGIGINQDIEKPTIQENSSVNTID